MGVGTLSYSVEEDGHECPPPTGMREVGHRKLFTG